MQVMKGRCVLVLGMHNSGTSLVGSLLHAIGAPMGPRLLLRDQIAEHKRPAYDYFEDKDVVDLQDKTLAKLDRHWSSYKASLPLLNVKEDVRLRDHLSDFESSLALLLQSRMAFAESVTDSSMWVVKDPRTSILLSSWLRVMDWLQIEPVFLVVHRNAAANIQSFSKKGQVPLRWAEALWQQTYVQIGKHITSASSFYALDFQQMLDNPLHVAKELKEFLSLHADQPLEKLLKNAVDQSLPSKHTEFNLTSLSEMIEFSLKESRFSDLPSPDHAELEAYKIQADLAPATQLNLHDLEVDFLNKQSTFHFNRKRICLLTAELQGYGPSGGIGTAMLELALELISSGHHVEVWLVGNALAANPSGRLDMIHIRHLSGETEDQDPGKFRQQIADSVLAEPFDVVHCHDWLGLGAFLRAQTIEHDRPIVICGLHGPTEWVREGSPLSSNIDSMPIDNQSTRESSIIQLEWQSIIQADVLVSPSLYLKNWVSEYLAERELYPDIYVQLNCPSLTASRHSRGNYDLPAKSKNSLIFFGRLEERKGIHLFLDALSILGPQLSPVYLIGADAPFDGGLASQIVEKHLKKLDQPFYWLPDLNRDEAHEFLHALGGIVVIPSLIENSPYTVQELLDTSLRVVATSVGGIPELVDNRFGSLADPNPQDLADKIRKALSESSDSSSIFKLRSLYSHARISLSWHAFHSRLPKRCSMAPAWATKDAVLLITLDSCRLDTFESISTPSIDKVGPLHRAISPSYFTYASHAAMFMGFLPSVLDKVSFINSKFAKVFRLSKAAFQATRAKEGFELSGNSIVTGMKRKGYFTLATGSVNWFDPATETGRELVRDFEAFWFAGNTWSLRDQLKWIDNQLAHELDRPPFIFLNIGETHVPYWHQGASWSKDDNPCLPFQKQDRHRDCQLRQRACLEFVDQQLSPLLERFSDATVIVCSDHGDCWGEDGLWEHGVSHQKTLAVPLLMRIRGRPIGAPLKLRKRIISAAKNKLKALLSTGKSI